MKELRISHKELDSIWIEREVHKPYEACGVMIGTIDGDAANVEKIVPIVNIRKSQASFELDPGQFYDAWNNAKKDEKEVIGIYHTHPGSSASPSLWDLETMQNLFCVWLIISSDDAKACIWGDGIKTVKLNITNGTK